MIEIKNLTKVYKPKKGVAVKALDNISLKFPKTGMIFILGKSGSGKSTLLNVLGGLDGFNSGEILIKGESAKDFKQSHYDSYRNTYIGFIFQEYNILEDFTVGANIALALELQGIKATNEEINNILEQVDLVEFGDRKPNELSGGQKQRVAIARALIKKPEIIMADEPTGALDSKTGKQIFDTLKKLSKTKLVLIVSHDRDFAMNYADRIIELADGKIIDDVEITASQEQENDDNLEFNNNTISIKRGYQLTEEDRVMINNYIKSLKDNVTIDLNKQKALSYNVKKTDESKIELDNSGFKLIKSKLSVKNSFKIGASGLKFKKFRLIITILLSFIAFTLFGLTDTIASYDKVKTTVNSLVDSNITCATFRKQVKNIDGESYLDFKFTDEDILKLQEECGIDIQPVYKDNYNSISSLPNENQIEQNVKNKKILYPEEITGMTEMDNTTLTKYGYSLAAGRLPEEDNEICITSYIYDAFKTFGYLSGEELVKINNTEDLLNKDIYIGSNGYKVVGIIDTKLDLSRYDKLVELQDSINSSTKNMLTYMVLLNELQSAQQFSLNCVIVVNKGLINKIAVDTNSRYIYNGSFRIGEDWSQYNQKADIGNHDYIYFNNDNKLSENGIMISANRYLSLFSNSFYSKYQDVTAPSKVKSFYEDYATINWGYIPTNYQDVEALQMAYSNFMQYVSYQLYVQKGKNLEYVRSVLTSYNPYNDYEQDRLLWEFMNNINNLLVKTNDSEKDQALAPFISEYTTLYNTLASEFRQLLGNELFIEASKFESLINSSVINGYTIDSYNKVYFTFDYISSQQFFNGDYLLREIAKGYYANQKLNDTEYIASLNEKYNYNVIEYMINNGYQSYFFEINDEDLLPYMKNVYKILSEVFSNKVNLYFGYKYDATPIEVTIDGIYFNNSDYNGIEFSQNLIDTYHIEIDNGKYSMAIGNMPENKSDITNIVKDSYENNDVRFSLYNNVIDEIDTIDQLLIILRQIFFWVGVALAVFASLMLMNFISTSVNHKKQDIGILRAIGSRSNDVFRIFFSESFIIAMINFILSLIGTITVIIFTNIAFRRDVGLMITVLNFGVRQVFLLLVISVGVAFLSTLLPVKKIASKKPIDAIRKR